MWSVGLIVGALGFMPVRQEALAVQILSPAAGAQLPADAPIEVQFAARRGPFLEVYLQVDAVLVNQTLPAASETQMTGTLTWDAPTPGVHSLVVLAVDMNKNVARAEIQIQVTGDARTPVPTIGSTEMQLRFVNLTDGGTVEAALDDSAKAFVNVVVEASGVPTAGIGLWVDDVPMPAVDNPLRLSPFVAEFHWSPPRGAGTYALRAEAISDDKQFSAELTIQITVTGLPVFTPTPPPLDEAGANRRMVELFQQVWGITLATPSLIYFESSQPDFERWVATAYINGQMYEIDLFNDTHYDTYVLPYADHTSDQDVYVLCRPAGVYRVLVVFVDYGNLDITPDEALSTVPVGVEAANRRYAALSQPPILTIEAVGAYVASPPVPGQFLMMDQIQALTGFDPAQFDLVAQVDLDANKTTAKTMEETVGTLVESGMALQGCGLPTKGMVNIWIIVSNEIYLPDSVRYTLFDHELGHLFGYRDGWPPHTEVNEEGLDVAIYLPAVLYGWTDTDGDRVVEILDPTPYGMNAP